MPWGMVVIRDIYFLTMVLSVVMLAHYAERDLRPALIKALKWTFLVFYAAVVVLVLLNHWTGVLYTVTPDGGYIRSPANVIKYTKNGGQIIVRIIRKPDYSNGYATYEFHVKDNGIGMSKEFQKHLFEAFTREESTTVSGIRGTGHGMAISKNIVDMMGGTISVESEEGKGTEYTVSIPFKVLSTSAKYEVVPQLQGVRVLVADDDSNTAISVSRMVQEIGIRSEWALSGKEAVLRTKVAVEQNDEFGAYIIDWMMPDLNGIETVRRIRKLIGESKPIIILTAYDWSDIEQEAREAGVTAFCSKLRFMSELRDVLTQPYRVEKEEPSERKHDFHGKRL